jgi:nitrite reductase/ring-hydroxylating ferredoxin subunit
MALTKVAVADDLKPGQVMEVSSGDRTFALCNTDGEIHCLDGTCPHAGGPLGEGTLQGDMLVCPWHGWEYNAKTGVNDSDEDVVVDTFPVVVKDGSIFIDIPE